MSGFMERVGKRWSIAALVETTIWDGGPWTSRPISLYSFVFQAFLLPSFFFL